MGTYETRRVGQWQVRIAEWAKEWAPSPGQVLQQGENPRQVLRDSHHSFMLLCDPLPEAPLGLWVLKRPVAKDKAFWIRLTTLYRKGAAERMFLSALKLWQLGIQVPRAIMQMERRRWGMIVESWYIYGYVPGRRCRKRHVAQILAILERLHRQGLCHGDPHPLNWLNCDEEVFALDMALHTRRPRPFWAALDHVLLNRHAPHLARPLFVSPIFWHGAKGYFAMIQLWRWIKQKRKRFY